MKEKDKNNGVKEGSSKVEELKVTDENDYLSLTSDEAPPEIPFEEFFEEYLEENPFENKVKVNAEDYCKKDLPARKLWGFLTLKLREKNYVTLHTACGEIRDVTKEADLLKAFVYEDYLFNILTKKENFDKILFELNEIDDKISLEFILKRVGKNKSKNNLQLLKNLFGEEIGVE
ncbi:MAG: hypothetical protein EOM55_03780 [Clostridia bacterium]|nr:hypothetical protein [Clostridia bacterium]